MHNICAFSTSDDAYAGKALASLLTIRKHNPDIPLFIISSWLSLASKQKLKKYNVDFIIADLSQEFHTTWDYPIECYYLFAGPHLLKQRGFKYSIYIDGDVYCNGSISGLSFSKIKNFAGVPNRTAYDMLKKDLPVIKTIFGDVDNKVKRLQTGILFFNNDALAKLGFYKKISSIYQTAIDNNIPRKGDDSLFALFRLAYPNWHYLELPQEYNLLTGSERTGHEWLTHDEDMITGAKFVHFTDHVKPWQSSSSFPTYTYEYFYHAWRRRAVDSFDSEDLKDLFPKIHNYLSDDHLRFYWYPGKNVGDLITPYYLLKVCKVSNLDDYSINEDAIMSMGEAKRQSKLQRALSLFTKRSANEDSNKRARYCVSTGSVIRLCNDYAIVFGSGIRSSNQEVHNSIVRFVRGPITRRRFIDSGFACPPIFGDPGLLLPRFYKPNVKKKFKVGIIPHFTEYDLVKKHYEGQKQIIIIDMGCGDLESVINDISSCDMTVSSSLHGLVLSHAYKVPTRRIEYSNNIFGDGTKFKDYYESIGLKPLAAINAHGFKEIPISNIVSVKKEVLSEFDDYILRDSLFFDENGFKKSARYPH